MLVVGVDPGVTTGVAFGVLKNGHFALDKGFECAGSLEGILTLSREIKGFFGSNRGVVVVEDFRLRGGPVGTTKIEGLAPVAVGAMLKMSLFMLKFDVAGGVMMQTASQAKTTVTNERLRALGLWVVGSEHIRDAVRHAELWCRKNQR